MACDVADSLSDLWFRLGFLSQGDLDAAAWLTPADLYQFADEAVQRLAYTCGLFKVFDSSVSVTSSIASVTMPAGHIFTVFAYILYNPSFAQILRLTNVEQLFALDASWTAQTGWPTRLSFDAGFPGTGGLGIATLYPAASQAGSLCQVMQQAPAPVAAGSSVLPISPILTDYFTYAVLATTLGKESDHSKSEVAAHCQERMGLYQKVLQQYFGPGM